MPSSTSSATNRRFGSRATSRAGALGTRTARSRPRQLGVRTRACSTTSTRTETARSCIRRQTTHSRPRCSGAAIAWTSRRRPSGSGPRARRETRVPRPRAPAWPDPRPLLLLRGGLPHPQFLCWLLRWGPVRKRQQLRSRRKFTMLLGSSCTGTTRRTTRRASGGCGRAPTAGAARAAARAGPQGGLLPSAAPTCTRRPPWRGPGLLEASQHPRQHKRAAEPVRQPVVRGPPRSAAWLSRRPAPPRRRARPGPSPMLRGSARCQRPRWPRAALEGHASPWRPRRCTAPPR
mmetsp:Transcript_90724/g.290833  ORF Transcript_90724/g.290833 Transcript_90724/m.290833 type:complete len:290 (-) Transcript_90724:1022-1891(-)